MVLFTLAMNALYFYGYTNIIFLVICNLLCAYWFYIGVLGFKAENDQLWAKRFFLFSVILITVISLSFSFTFKSPAPMFPLF